MIYLFHKQISFSGQFAWEKEEKNKKIKSIKIVFVCFFTLQRSICCGRETNNLWMIFLRLFPLDNGQHNLRKNVSNWKCFVCPEMDRFHLVLLFIVTESRNNEAMGNWSLNYLIYGLFFARSLCNDGMSEYFINNKYYFPQIGVYCKYYCR